MTKHAITLALVALLALPALAAAHGPPAITEGPEGVTSEKAVTFGFEYGEPAVGEVFECQLDDTPYVDCGELGPTGGEGTITYEDVAEGPHTFRVKRTGKPIPHPDPIGSPDATERKFTVDSIAPETTITASPVTSAATTAHFEFSASEPQVFFECTVDGKLIEAECLSPLDLSGLAVGDHRVSIVAYDLADNAETTPAEHAWSVTAPVVIAPPAPVAPGPATTPGVAGALPAGTVPTITVGKKARKAKAKRCATKKSKKKAACKKKAKKKKARRNR